MGPLAADAARRVRKRRNNIRNLHVELQTEDGLRVRRSGRKRKWRAPAGVAQLDEGARCIVYLPPWTKATVTHDYNDGNYQIRVDGQKLSQAKTYDLKDPDYQRVVRRINDDVNDVPCKKCRQTGDDERFLVCERSGCNNGWHTYCMDPPLAEVPKDAWFCPACVEARKSRMTCRGGHGLQLFHAPTAYQCTKCDICVDKNTEMWGCGLCNFDVCLDCFASWQQRNKNKKVLLNIKQSREESTAISTKQYRSGTLRRKITTNPATLQALDGCEEPYYYSAKEKMELIDIYCEMVWGCRAEDVSGARFKKVRRILRRNNWDLNGMPELDRSPASNIWNYEVDVTD